jgi:Rieske Fe-S protein
MERKEFLKVCGGACLGMLGFSILVQSCGTVYYAQAELSEKKLRLAKTEFETLKDGEIKYRKFVLVKREDSNYPILVNRMDANTYSAYEMKCTHLGNVLAVIVNIFTCASHGSEFDLNGKVLQGPASEKLQSYPVALDDKMIYIQLG